MGGSRPGVSFSAFDLTEEQFEHKVKEYIGIPYRRGGTSRKGMDCSSFVRTVYDRFFGIDLPYTAGAQFDFSGFKKINTREMQPGDLIFFTTNKKKRVSHVGMYLSGGQFIHASSSRGITLSSLENHYWKKRFVGSRRHTALNVFHPDSDPFQLGSIFKIPVNQNGEIPVHTGYDFRLNSPASTQGRFNSVDMESKPIFIISQMV